jgi:hypothetical protein
LGPLWTCIVILVQNGISSSTLGFGLGLAWVASSAGFADELRNFPFSPSFTQPLSQYLRPSDRAGVVAGRWSA